jgi:cardiolipin synthase A/B
MAGTYMVAIYNLFRVLDSKLTPGARIAWLTGFLLAPVVTVPLYYLFGQNRLRGYIRKAVRREREFAEVKQPVVDEASGHFQASNSIELLFTRLGGHFQPSLNHVELLIDGTNTFTSIFEAVANARHIIFVQYYILRSDRLGIELKNLLIQRAQAGVKVYLLYDEVGCFWLSSEYLGDLRKSGVKLAPFLPLRSFKRGFQLNFRNHRKLVVVDGETAYTGGLNVGEEYVGGKARDAHWRDTHLRIQGPAVRHLEDIFLSDWFFATHELIEVPELTSALVSSNHPQLPDFSPNRRVQVVPTGPSDKTPIGLFLFMQMIQSAKQRLWVTTPYFIPDLTLIREFELALLRGVDVRLLIPEVSDYPWIHWVSKFYAEQLLSKGMKVYLYQKGFLHQKVVLIDQTSSAIGTSNFDNRTVFLNFETTVLIHDADFNQQASTMLEADFRNSKLMVPATGPVRRRLIRMRAAAIRLFEPLL